MKSNFTKFSLVALAVMSTFSSGCSKSNEPSNSSNAGGLNAAMSAESMQKVAIANLPQADKSTPLEQYTKLDSDHQLMFAYYAFSGLPIDYEKIAANYSQEYRNTSDTFKKNDILTALKPRIDAEMTKIKTQRYFKIDNDTNLGHYDTAKKSFAINDAFIRGDSYLYFNNNNDYKIGITNGDQFGELKVADENLARSIEKMVSDRAGLGMQLYIFAQDVDPSDAKVKFQIVKIKLTDRRGTELLTQ